MPRLGPFLVASLSVLLVDTELLLDTFTNTGCAQFFFHQTEPSNAFVPQNAAWICQRYGNQYHFATLYDRKNRIPVYSAYIYQPGPGARADWLIEPQLVDKTYSKSMENEYSTKINKQSLEQSQAVSADYKQTSQTYDRGHLNPSLHHNTSTRKTATFTLTNIVPQHNKLNQGTWNTYEEKTMKNMTAGCNETYALVGAIPGTGYISDGRINVPSHIWTAACCTHNNGPKAWAGIAENTERNQVTVFSLGDLEKEIAQLLNRSVKVFHDGCPRKCNFPPFTLKEEKSRGNKSQRFPNFVNISSIFACFAIVCMQYIVQGYDGGQ